eukprot:242334_1
MSLRKRISLAQNSDDAEQLLSFSSPPAGISTIVRSKNQQLLVSFKSSGMQTYDLSTNSLCSSWPVTTEQPLTASTVYHSHSDRYFGVSGERTLIGWVEKKQKLVECCSLEMVDDVHSVASCGDLEEILVIFKNGTVALVSHDLKLLLRTRKDSANPRATVAHAFVRQHNTVYLTVACHTRTCYVLDIYELKPASSLSQREFSDVSYITTHSLMAPATQKSPGKSKQRTKLLSFAVEMSSKRLVLCWSTGVWQLWHFSGSLKSKPKLDLARQTEFDPSSPILTSCLESSVLTAGISEGCPVLKFWDFNDGSLLKTVQLESSSDSDEPRRKKRCLPNSSPKKSRKNTSSSQEIIQLCTDSESSRVVIATNGAVFSGIFRVKKLTLAQSLVSMSSSKDESPLDSCDLSSPMFAQSEKDVIEKMKSAKSEAEFSEALASVFPEEASDPRATLQLSPTFIHCVSRECLRLRYWSPLRRLVTSCRLSAGEWPELVGELVEHKKMKIIGDCLNCIPDISEDDVVVILRHALKAAKSQKSRKSAATLIRSIIATPLNPHFLRSAISVLTEIELSLLLAQIQVLLEAQTPLGVSPENQDDSGDILLQVIDFLSLLADAHFAQMVLSAECTATLRSIFRVIKRTSLACDVCEKLRGLIDARVGLSSVGVTRVSTRKHIPEYCVESLVI